MAIVYSTKPHISAPAKPQAPVRVNRLDALSIWHRVTMQTVRNTGPDLTTRQFVILTTIYLVDGAHTVRSLAKHLNVTKAVITRALDTLGRYGFVQRDKDPRDKRSIIIQRTPGGSTYLRTFGDQICQELQAGVTRPNIA